jgi:hypothetical protein
MALNQACSFFIKGCCIGCVVLGFNPSNKSSYPFIGHENPAPTYSCEDIRGHSKKMKHSLKKRKMENIRQTEFIRIHSNQAEQSEFVYKQRTRHYKNIKIKVLATASISLYFLLEGLSQSHNHSITTVWLGLRNNYGVNQCFFYQKLSCNLEKDLQPFFNRGHPGMPQ